MDTTEATTPIPILISAQVSVSGGRTPTEGTSTQLAAKMTSREIGGRLKRSWRP